MRPAEQLVPIAGSELRLDITGMTCASCAARIEKRLNRLEGVSASVNYATEQATVTYPRTLTPDALIAQVEATGYSAVVHRSSTGGPDADGADASDDAPLQALRR